MNRHTWDVSLVVQGPILTKSSSIGAPGLDAVMARGTFEAGNKTERRFYLPGALVKGLLREAWQEMGVSDPQYGRYALEWLGSKSDDANDSPKRGLLHFSDFADTSTVTNGKQPHRYRIQIEEARGAASGRMLQVMESPYAPGQRVTFRGTIRTAGLRPEMRDAILRGLRWIRAVGGNRGIGFGQVLGADVSDPAIATAGDAVSPTETAWQLRLRFSQPVVFSKRRISGNLFESSDVIPGAALIGAIAQMIEGKAGFDELRRGLATLKFTHAFPTKIGGNRPQQVPLSLALVNGAWTDAMDLTTAPKELMAFRIDWKTADEKEILQKGDWPTIQTELRVRTRIYGERRKAKEKELFAWHSLVPYEHEWVSTVDTEPLSEAARGQLARVLLIGIEPLGKTKALASVSIVGSPLPTLLPASHYDVMLQTPALMIDPRRIHALRGDETNTLRSEYERAWGEFCSDVELVRYFGSCALAGGGYFHRRFGSDPQRQYKPYLLTEAGTVFRLRPLLGREMNARAALESLIRDGLFIRGPVRDYYGIPESRSEQWPVCPYTPNKGYGEICVLDQRNWSGDSTNV